MKSLTRDEEIRKTINGKVLKLVYEKLANSTMTVPELARSIGISHTTLYGMYKDVCATNIYSLVKIAEYFGVSLDWLTGREDKKHLEEK